MVVDDVEDHRDAERVRAIDEAAEIVRATVEPGRREQIDPVIAPAEAAREIGDRHQLDAGDAECGEFRQFARGRLPAPLRGEGADMHLVDDQLLARAAAPALVGPAERGRDRRSPTARAAPPAESARPGRAAAAPRCRCGSRSACRAAPRATRAREIPSASACSAIAAAGRRSRPRSRGTRGAQTRKCTPPCGCGSAPTGRRRTKPASPSRGVAIALLSNTVKSALIYVDPDQWLHGPAGQTAAIGDPPTGNMG